MESCLKGVLRGRRVMSAALLTAGVCVVLLARPSSSILVLLVTLLHLLPAFTSTVSCWAKATWRRFSLGKLHFLCITSSYSLFHVTAGNPRRCFYKQPDNIEHLCVKSPMTVHRLYYAFLFYNFWSDNDAIYHKQNRKTSSSAALCSSFFLPLLYLQRSPRKVDIK